MTRLTQILHRRHIDMKHHQLSNCNPLYADNRMSSCDKLQPPGHRDNVLLLVYWSCATLNFKQTQTQCKKTIYSTCTKQNPICWNSKVIFLLRYCEFQTDLSKHYYAETFFVLGLTSLSTHIRMVPVCSRGYDSHFIVMYVSLKYHTTGTVIRHHTRGHIILAMGQPAKFFGIIIMSYFYIFTKFDSRQFN